jgi:hypothetical protein
MTVDRSNRGGTSVKKPFTVPLALHRVSPLVGTPIIRCKIYETKKSPVAFSFLERASLFVKEGCGYAFDRNDGIRQNATEVDGFLRLDFGILCQ